MTSTSRIVTGPDTVEHAGARAVRVQLVRGSLEVVGRAEPGVHVEVAHLDGGPLEVAFDGSQASVGYPTIGWDGWLKRLATTTSNEMAHVRLHVGPGVAVHAATVSAQVGARDLDEDADVATANAAVVLERCTGAAKVRTASGAVDISSHTGPVTVVTAAGPVTLDGDIPRASVTTVAGDARLRHRGGAALLSATTVSGAIRVQLPLGTPVELEVRGIGASVLVDGESHGGGFGVTRVEEPGSGRPVAITATTVTGEVSVERSDPPELDWVEDAPVD